MMGRPKVKWSFSCKGDDRDEKVAKQLQKQILKLYAYAKKQHMTHVDFTTLNVDDDTQPAFARHSCHLAVRALRKDKTVVDDYTWTAFIEEK